MHRYLFEARRRTYTKHNILAAWEKAGIQPLNPRRVLNTLVSPLIKPTTFAVSGPTTPRTTRMARSTSKEALSLIKGSTDSALKLRALIYQLDKGLQMSITEKEIGDHISAQFRKSVAKRAGKASTADRKQLSKARVITTEEVVRLREAREAADAKKAAQALAREKKKKLKESQGTPVAKPKAKSKKQVTISENITVHIIESDSEEEGSIGTAGGEGSGGVHEAEEEWANIDDFPDSPPPSTTRRASRRRGGYQGAY